MLHKYALEYCGYLIERIVAYDEEIDKLDMSQQVEHYTSSGWDEPIYSTGMGPRYRIQSIDLPEWISVKAYMGNSDYRERANAIIYSRHIPTPQIAEKLMGLFPSEIKAAIALLEVRKFRSPFLAGLRAQVDAWLAGNGQYRTPLSPRQMDCVYRSYHIR